MSLSKEIYIKSNKDEFTLNTSPIERTLFYDDLLRTLLEYLSCNELFPIKLVCKDFNRVVCVMHKDSNKDLNYYKDDYYNYYKKIRINNHFISNKKYFYSSLLLLKWSIEMKTSIYKIDHYACENGSLELLQYLLSNHKNENGLKYKNNKLIKFKPNSNWCNYATKGGQLPIVQRLRSVNSPCPWDYDTCGYAVKGGHFEILKWLRSQNQPCPWDYDKNLNASGISCNQEINKWIKSQSTLSSSTIVKNDNDNNNNNEVNY